MVSQRPLKIGFRVGIFPKRSETFVLNQIKGMVERGHDVSVLADESIVEQPVDSLPDWHKHLKSVKFIEPGATGYGRWHRVMPLRVKRALRRRAERAMCAEVDVLVCNFGWFGESVVRSAPHRNQSKVVTIFHGADMSRSLLVAKNDPYKELFDNGGLFLPISAHWRAELISLGAPPERIALHRMGVDLDQFSFRTRTEVVGRPFRFITVCRFVEKKGIRFALEAMGDLAARSDVPGFTFEIIGDGPLDSALKEQVHILGLGDRVVFRGELPHEDVSLAMADADAFVLPSIVAQDGDMEGIPVVLMEAMASGLPVVSTRHSGIPELIQDRTNGLLANQEDSAGLAEILLVAMRDPAGQAERAILARRTVESRFDMKKLDDQLERYLVALSAGETDVRSIADEH
jgi:colanic acid/amylovoran biosynthesis glycosyltransferase